MNRPQSSPPPIFDSADAARLAAAGITPDDALRQLDCLRRGAVFQRLLRPGVIGDGIETSPKKTRAEEAEEAEEAEAFQRACAEGRVLHFIPASGAASRMVAAMQRTLEALHTGSADELEKRAAAGDVDARSAWKVWREWDRLPFDRIPGSDWNALRSQGNAAALLAALLHAPGQGVAELPKAMVPFHRHGAERRTPLEEHLREASALAGPAAVARVHFTFAPEHEAQLRCHLDQMLRKLRAEGLRLEADYSLQAASTQTLALDADGNPFRDADGTLVLRPGGHGSLLANLAACGAEFAWIRNIDNIAAEPRRSQGRLRRRALAGRLIRLAAERDALLRGAAADGGALWLRRLGATPAGESEVLRVADRPLRVCGMVPNTGEPGGGPFWAAGPQGAALRIVEASEVDASDPAQTATFRSATHFNPVDMVCALRDARGRPYHLPDFADADGYGVASKTYAGRPLRALEWPGLWNGGMAGWNTVCVEIPLALFSPVKTVLDLLRPDHQETA